MKVFTIITALLLCGKLLSAQTGNADLLLQSPDGKTVKLLWQVKDWNGTITGFDIKRKEGLEDWVKINIAPILPGISAKDDLEAVESDKSEASRIRARLYKMVADKKLTEITHTDYLQKLVNNDKEVRDINMLMTRDYDVALICGFAFVDHSVTQRSDYEYGLFIAGTNTLLATASWNYGEIPDLNVITEITSMATTQAKGIHLAWTADINKLYSSEVAGFNIYRHGIRLNPLPITATSAADAAEFTWYDKSASGGSMGQYSISAASIFGIEGIIKPYTYNPSEHTSEYRIPETKEIESLGFYFKDGIGVKWIFPVEFEKYLKGFYVEKDPLPGGYKTVSPLLPPTARYFVDKTPSQASDYIQIRVVAVYKDKTKANGPGRLYTYFPLRQPPIPQNFKVSNTTEEHNKYLVTLSWDPRMNGDTVTTFYNVYVSGQEGEKFTLATAQPVKANSFTFVADGVTASSYKFYVAGISRIKEQSDPTDTVTVKVPSVVLPAPVITNGFPDGGSAIVRWEYATISDLKGFRVYQDNNLIADEKSVDKDKREFKTAQLMSGGAYQFTIVAVSERNVLSPVSAAQLVTIPAANKK